MEDIIIKELKKLSLKAWKHQEVPIGCIIVRNGKIVSKAYNKKESKNNPLLHAEVVAITKACKKLKDWRLDDCEMYVTLEPCNMCKEIIKESRIKKVIYILESKVDKKILTNYEKCDKEEGYFKKIISSFFQEKR